MRSITKISLSITLIVLTVFFTVKVRVLTETTPSTDVTRWTEFYCILCLVPLFGILGSEFRHKRKEIEAQFEELTSFIDHATLISKADAQGRITYVNQKFIDVSGWSLSEVIGQDHRIVNSGEHDRSVWADMYRTTVKDRQIWNMIVTNRTKDGQLYHVDTYIKALFNTNGRLTGYMSIRQDVSDIIASSQEIEKKNIYLEHAAKIIRHDMHSGINTYIPRGISSLERRLSVDDIHDLKIEAPFRMIKEGLRHAQKVYRGVYEFTNLVKKDAVLNKASHNIREILSEYLSATAYKSQVILNPNLTTVDVNESLFCTALDNLIRNGLKYNDSDSKWVKVFMEDDLLVLQDNGRGMTAVEFDALSKPYTRKAGQKESGSGLGLNICMAILDEHGFLVSCEKNEIGTKLKIKINNS